MELNQYYEQNKNNRLFQVFYQQIINNGYLIFLLEVIKIDPNFNISKFDHNYFNKNLIANYSLAFLAKALTIKIPIKLLESGIRDQEFKEKIMHFSNFDIFNLIGNDLIYLDDFTIEFFDCILKHFDKFEQICLFKLLRLHSRISIKLVQKVLGDETALFNLKFLITHFDEVDFKLENFQEDILVSPKFTNFIKAIKNSFFTSKTSLSTFISLFKKYEKFFESEIIIGSTEIVTSFLIDHNRDKYGINTLADFYNFEQLRYNYYQANFNSELITQSYFGITLAELTKRIKIYLSRNEIVPFLSLNEINFLNDLIQNKNYLDVVANNFRTLEQIENRYKNICRNDIVNNLFYIKSNEPVINISRTFFNILAHRIRTDSGSNPIGERLTKDLTEWDRNFIPDAYLSTTPINQYCLDLIKGGNYILGFTNITPEDILDMGFIDIYSSIRLYRNQMQNENSRFDLFEELMNSDYMGYKEITLKRFRENLAIKPDVVLTFDQLTPFATDASSYFKVPILLIDSFQSASFMDNHNQELLIQDRIKEYADYLLRMYSSFKYNYDITAKYFSANTLNNTVNELVKRCRDLKSKELISSVFYLINILEHINACNFSLEYNLGHIETKEFRKKLIF